MLRGGLTVATAAVAVAVSVCAVFVAWSWLDDAFPGARLVALAIGSVAGLTTVFIRRRKTGSRLPAWVWLAVVLPLAAGVRIAFFATVHPVPVSEIKAFASPGDDLEFHRLAVRLLTYGDFADPDDDYCWDSSGNRYPLDPPQRAWRTPGFAFALAGIYALFGQSADVGGGLNIALGVLLVWLCYGLGRRVGGETVGRLAGLIVAVFPSLVLWSCLLFAETLMAVLVVGSLWAYAASVDGDGRARRWVAPAVSGLLMGLAALTRGTVVLWPLGLGLWELLSGSRFRDMLRRGGIATVVMILTVLPWTFRNYTVFDRFVPLSSNGGGNYYSSLSSEEGTFNATAWNKLHRDVTPESHGRDYELARNDEGWRRARAILAEDPGRPWRQLPAKFQMFFSRDDQGVYWTMERNSPRFAPMSVAWRGLSNVAWMALLTWLTGAAIGCVIDRRLRRKPRATENAPRRRMLLLPVTFCLYLCAIHMIFESQDRYHLTLAPLLIILAIAFTVGRPGDPASTSNPSR